VNNDISPGLDFLTFDPNVLLDGFLKILFISGFLIYLIFAFMVIRQTSLMEESYRTALGPFLKLFALAHFLVAVGIFVFAFIAL
jgi:hypothetical protein